MLRTYGAVTDRIPVQQKVTLTCADLDLRVVGLLEQESEAMVTNQFSEAFGQSMPQQTLRGGIALLTNSDAGDSLGTGDSDMALISSLNTLQAYEGSEPPMLDLPLVFLALQDPANEVEKAVEALKEMSLPYLTTTAVESKPPPKVTINLRRQILLTEGRIESLMVQDFGAISEKGTLWAKVSVSLKAMQMPSRNSRTAG